jgi:hypothetical protein
VTSVRIGHIQSPERAKQMKTCPYRKEDVKDDAVKCKWCRSELGDARDEMQEQKAVYVVDKELIRFAKFIAASIAIERRAS